MASDFSYVPNELLHQAVPTHALGNYPASLAGVDASCSVLLPFFLKDDTQSPLVRLPGLIEVNFSIHKDTYPVYNNSSLHFKGFTEGHITEAGSLVFNINNQHPFAEVMERYNRFLAVQGLPRIFNVHDLPPLDVLLVFITKDGETYAITVEGMKAVDSSTNITIEARATSGAISFMCKRVKSIAHLENTVADLPPLAALRDVVANIGFGGGGGVSNPTVTDGPTTPVPTTTPPPTTTDPPTTTAAPTTTEAPTTTATEPTVSYTTGTTLGTNTLTTGVPLIPGIPNDTSPYSTLILENNINVNAIDSFWYDTGIILTGIQRIVVTVTGTVSNGVATAYPEGVYIGSPPADPGDPSLTILSDDIGGDNWASINCRPYSLVGAVNFSNPGRSINSGRQTNRSYTEIDAVGKLWFQFNDRGAAYANNTGHYTVNIKVYE